MKRLKRRDFVHLCSGITVASVMPLYGETAAAPSPRQIIVVGGGIMGASIAYHLARRGARVKLLEKIKPAAGATGKAFAWINAGSKRPRGHFELNRMGMAGWRRLQNELGCDRLIVQWGGTVRWEKDEAKAAKLRESFETQVKWGYSTREVSEPEIRRLLPDAEPGPVAFATYCDEEGVVDPVHACQVLIEGAKESGVEVIYPCAVTGFDVVNGGLRAVLTSKGRMETDGVVLACGIDVPPLAAMLGGNVPLIPSPGVLVHTKPVQHRINRVVIAPGATIKQNHNGAVVTGVDFDSSVDSNISGDVGQTLIANAARYAPRLKGAELDYVEVCLRPYPKDRQPIVGALKTCRDAYVAVMHSGITLSPVIGQLAATEILQRVELDTLEPYRFTRFT